MEDYQDNEMEVGASPTAANMAAASTTADNQAAVPVGAVSTTVVSQAASSSSSSSSFRLTNSDTQRSNQELFQRKMPFELLAELVAEIFCRLPVNVILQIRCVSKRWRAFIDSPFFIRTHLSRSIKIRKNHFLILSQSYSDVLKSLDLDSLSLKNAVDLHNPFNCRHHLKPIRSPPFMKKAFKYPKIPKGLQIILPRWKSSGSLYKMTVWGTCNGLVLLSNWCSTCVWNPTTRKHLNLPRLESARVEKYMTSCGLGYDFACDDYKVLAFWKDQVWIYTLQSSLWRKVDMSFPDNITWKRQPGVFVCGALHWPMKLKSESDGDEDDVIFAFDVNAEEYRIFSPPKCQNPKYYSRLGVFNELLCFIYSYMPVGFEIWVMVDHGVDESWTRVTLRQDDFISYPGGFTKILDESGISIKTPTNFGIRPHDQTDVCIVSLVSLLDGGGPAANHQLNQEKEEHSTEKSSSSTVTPEIPSRHRRDYPRSKIRRSSNISDP